MMRDVIRYKRGQVWKRVSSSNYTIGSVQSRNRPVLIVSSDEGNNSQKTVICVKITSQVEKGKLSVNVPFRNDRNEDNVVLCNQIETVDKSELTEYMFTMSDDIMKQVEKARLISEGMIDYTDNINATLNNIYRVLSRLETCKGHEYTDENATNTKIKETAMKLEELHNHLALFYNRSAEEIMKQIDPMTDFFNRRDLGKIEVDNKDDKDDSSTSENKSEISEDIKTKTSPKKKQRRNQKWTKEKMEEFIKDKAKMTPQAYAEKWGFETAQKAIWSFYNIKYKYRDTYGELPDDTESLSKTE